MENVLATCIVASRDLFSFSQSHAIRVSVGRGVLVGGIEDLWGGLSISVGLGAAASLLIGVLLHRLDKADEEVEDDS